MLGPYGIWAANGEIHYVQGMLERYISGHVYMYKLINSNHTHISGIEWSLWLCGSSTSSLGSTPTALDSDGVLAHKASYVLICCLKFHVELLILWLTRVPGLIKTFLLRIWKLHLVWLILSWNQ